MKISKRWQLLAGLVAGFAIGIGIAYLGDRMFGDQVPDAEASALRERFGLWLVPLSLVVSFLFAFTAIAVHEMGHVVGGLIVRFRFDWYVVGPLRIERGERDRIRAGLNRNLAMYGGMVAMVPTDTDNLRKRLFIMVAAGPAASLLLGFAAVMVGSEIIGILGLMSFAIFVATIVPFTAAGLSTDGRRMLRLMSSGPAATREAALLPLVAYWAAGRPPREWPHELVRAAIGEHDATPEEYNGRVFAYYHYLDAGEIAAARVEVERALALVETLPEIFRPAMHLEAAYFRACHDNDVLEARRLLDSVPQKAFGVQEYDRARADAAVLFAEGRREEARRIALHALDSVPERNPFTRVRLEDLARSA